MPNIPKIVEQGEAPTKAVLSRPLAGRTPRSRRWVDVVAPLGLITVALAAWEVTVNAADIAPYLLPKPSAVAKEIVDQRAVLATNFNVTLMEVIGGFALAFVTATALGIALAYSKVFRRTAMPMIVAWKAVPTIALAPLLVIWFGYNTFPRLLITALVCFFPMIVNTAEGLMSVDRQRELFFRSLGATRRQRFLKLALPTALPNVFTGIKVAVPLAVIGATISEWVGARAGLGYLILRETGLIHTSRVFASIALLAFMGVVLYALVSLVETWMMPWRRSSHTARR